MYLLSASLTTLPVDKALLFLTPCLGWRQQVRSGGPVVVAITLNHFISSYKPRVGFIWLELQCVSHWGCKSRMSLGACRFLDITWVCHRPLWTAVNTIRLLHMHGQCMSALSVCKVSVGNTMILRAGEEKLLFLLMLTILLNSVPGGNWTGHCLQREQCSEQYSLSLFMQWQTSGA